MDKVHHAESRKIMNEKAKAGDVPFTEANYVDHEEKDPRDLGELQRQLKARYLPFYLYCANAVPC